MKILVVYYSRTNVTKRIAETIRKELDCDIEEITDNGKYSGKLGFLKGGMNASIGRSSKINPITKNPHDYDLTIVGTPVWASNMAPPVFTYLIKYRDQIKNMASFCTCSSSGYENTLMKLAEVSRKKQVARMHMTSDDIENPHERINTFIDNIKNSI